MRLVKKSHILFLSVTLFSFISCESTPKSEPQTNKSNEEINQIVEEIDPAVIELENYKNSIKNLVLKIESSPAAVNVRKSFSKNFSASVKDESGSPVSDFSVIVKFPASKTESVINYETKVLNTDENGLVSFTAPQTSFAANEKVVFYPAPCNESEEALEAAMEKAVSADYLVKSDIITKGAVLFIWDFNEKGNPTNNSYEIQSKFRTKGITLVGNGPVSESKYIGKPQTLYRETYDIIGPDAYGYLLYGTITFEQPVTANEDKTAYTCMLKAEIDAINMKNGSKIYSKVFTYNSTGKNYNECVNNGKSNLAELVVSDIIYGL